MCGLPRLWDQRCAPSLPLVSRELVFSQPRQEPASAPETADSEWKRGLQRLLTSEEDRDAKSSGRVPPCRSRQAQGCMGRHHTQCRRRAAATGKFDVLMFDARVDAAGFIEGRNVAIEFYRADIGMV